MQTNRRNKREFEIAWQGLKAGLYTFQYDIDDRFMEEFTEEQPDFRDLNARVTLHFDKKSNFFLLKFDVDGTVCVPCDRCGVDFSLRLWDEFNLMIKLEGEAVEADEEDADVVFIQRHETVIDISRWIYEFVMLSIPLQRIHPDLEGGASGCDPEALKMLDSLSGGEESPAQSIWKGLDKLKDKEFNN